jgi:hypothetical protein
MGEGDDKVLVEEVVDGIIESGDQRCLTVVPLAPGHCRTCRAALC